MRPMHPGQVFGVYVPWGIWYPQLHCEVVSDWIGKVMLKPFVYDTGIVQRWRLGSIGLHDTCFAYRSKRGENSTGKENVSGWRRTGFAFSYRKGRLSYMVPRVVRARWFSTSPPTWHPSGFVLSGILKCWVLRVDDKIFNTGYFRNYEIR